MTTSRTRKAREEYPHKVHLYRARPVTVQAVLFDGSAAGAEYVVRFVRGHGGAGLWDNKRLIIWTPWGAKGVPHGVYVVRGVFGEVFPCDPDVFDIEYELQGEGNNGIAE